LARAVGGTAFLVNPDALPWADDDSWYPTVKNIFMDEWRKPSVLVQMNRISDRIYLQQSSGIQISAFLII